ncbi:hypothetical protein DYB32_004335 [Aphanomyces invadans]|uniref:DNA-directed DNA polymerase n=1 Tax=Aphanomyces invadans TaxID=157072 RepID=A0A3R6VMK6_9STRA|nr:hypothetical protein DYB32_004335 [Aphanomyces invadans]
MWASLESILGKVKAATDASNDVSTGITASSGFESTLLSQQQSPHESIHPMLTYSQLDDGDLPNEDYKEIENAELLELLAILQNTGTEGDMLDAQREGWNEHCDDEECDLEGQEDDNAGSDIMASQQKLDNPDDDDKPWWEAQDGGRLEPIAHEVVEAPVDSDNVVEDITESPKATPPVRCSDSGTASGVYKFAADPPLVHDVLTGGWTEVCLVVSMYAATMTYLTSPIKNPHTKRSSWQASQPALRTAPSIVHTSHVTILSVELHVNTREALLPDPAHDAVVAIGYTLEANEGSTCISETGLLLVDAADDATARSKQFLANRIVTVQTVLSEAALFVALDRLVHTWDPDFLFKLARYTFESVVAHVLKRRVPVYSFQVLSQWFQASGSVRLRALEHVVTKTMLNVSLLDAMQLITRTRKTTLMTMSRPVCLKLEKVYMGSFLVSKKRYVGLKFESIHDKGQLDAKGIETIRRDSCGVVQHPMRHWLRLLFATRDLSACKKYLQRYWIDMHDGNIPLRHYIFAKEVRLGTYAGYSSCLEHCR